MAKPGDDDYKTDEEIQAEIDDPHTKAIIIMPAARQAYLCEQHTINFPLTVPSVIDDSELTLKGAMDIRMRQALVGMTMFAADNDPEMAEKIDEFVALIREAEGKKLDWLASDRVQKQFSVGRYAVGSGTESAIVEERPEDYRNPEEKPL